MATYLIKTLLEIAFYEDGDGNLYPELFRYGRAREGYESSIYLPPLTTKIEVYENQVPTSGIDIYTLDGELLPVKTLKGLSYERYYHPLSIFEKQILEEKIKKENKDSEDKKLSNQLN